MSLTGVKGRLQTRVIENEDEKKYVLEVIAEKVTFLSSKPKEETLADYVQKKENN